MRFPPPFLFVLTFLTGYGLQRALGLSYAASELPRGLASLGWVLVGGGGVFVLSNVVRFAIVRTTIIPHRRSSKLLVTGFYRITRNPMYLGMSLIFVGVAALKGAFLPLLLLPIPVLIMDRVFIPFEEGHLREAFGKQFDDYTRRVRRWI